MATREEHIQRLEKSVIRWQECDLTHIDYYDEMVEKLAALKSGAAFHEVELNMEEGMLEAGRTLGYIARRAAFAVNRKSSPSARG